MTRRVNYVIIGQGIAGTSIAWSLLHRNKSFLIVDRGDAVTASRVAAGLMTPVAGRRHVCPPDFHDWWNAAKRLYEFSEQQTNAAFFKLVPMLLLFGDEASRDEFLRAADFRPPVIGEAWSGSLQTGSSVRFGARISPAGRLNAARYLEASRAFFEERNSFLVADVDVAKDLRVRSRDVVIERLGIEADQVILCQGATSSAMFPEVPNNPSRGDILRLRIPNYQIADVVHQGLWIAPNADGSQSVGATYDWKELSQQPSAAGRHELLGKLRRLIPEGDFIVEEHHAAVRPTMKDYQPVVGRHPDHDRIFLMNGLGSKGALRAPALADQLLDLIENGIVLPSEVSVERLRRRTSDGRVKPLTVMAQEAVGKVIGAGDTVIDGTVGNGFDTVFLATSVAPGGRVIGFDVQQEAIDSTTQRLTANQVTNVELRRETHEAIRTFPDNSVSAVMFNLGYLPRADRSLITRAESSVRAIEESIRVLRPDGVLSVLSYRGHDGGEEEFAAVGRLLQRFASRYHLETIESTPARATSPVLFVLHKSDI